MANVVVEPIRILIADDHPIFRDGLRRLLETESGFTVIGEADDGARAVALADNLKPDILLLDVAMPRLTGLGALQNLAKQNSTVKTILLTAMIEGADIVTALQLGARGVVLKDTATQLLFEAIRTVVAGGYWVGREAVGDLVKTLKQLTASTAEQEKKRTFGLTKRELTIVGSIVAGYTNKDIAAKLSISEDTVKHHLTNIYDKTGVSSRLELGLFAVHHKIVDDL